MKTQKRNVARLLIALICLLMVISLLPACSQKEPTPAGAISEVTQEQGEPLPVKIMVSKAMVIPAILFFISCCIIMGLFATALILAIIIMARRWL